MLVALLIFHLEISGKEVKLLHPENNELNSVQFLTPHLLISDMLFKLLHSLNMFPILVTFEVFEFEITSKLSKEIKRLNIPAILVILEVSNLDKPFIDIKFVQSSNILTKFLRLFTQLNFML